MSHIDWKLELRKIEREFDGKAALPSPAVIRARREIEQREKQAVEARVTQLSALTRLVLVVVLTAALPWWPYAARCGPGVAALLGAYAMVAIGGLWVATYSWRHRLATSHALSLAFLLTGLTLLASQVLPRAGLATITGIEASGWRCVASAPPGGAPVANARAAGPTALSTPATGAPTASMEAHDTGTTAPDGANAGAADSGPIESGSADAPESGRTS